MRFDALTQIYTTKEAARALKLSHRTLEDKRLRGDGPNFFRIGRSVRYREADLEAWMGGPALGNTGQASA